MTKSYHIAIVGATGAVGAELLRVLVRRNFPVAGLRAISSARSTGKSLRFHDELIPVQELVEHSFDKIDIAFFSAGGEVSREFVPFRGQGGETFVDNWQVFAMNPDVRRV